MEIIHDPDIVLSWTLTRHEMARKLGGDRKRAEDLLMADEKGSALWRRAGRIAAERAARASPGATSRRIIPEGL